MKPLSSLCLSKGVRKGDRLNHAHKKGPDNNIIGAFKNKSFGKGDGGIIFYTIVETGQKLIPPSPLNHAHKKGPDNNIIGAFKNK